MKVILLNVSFKNNIKLQKIPPRVPRLPRFPLKEPPCAPRQFTNANKNY